MNRFLLHLKIYGLLGCCLLIVLGQDSLSTSSEENATSGENLSLLMIRRDGAEDTKVTLTICRSTKFRSFIDIDMSNENDIMYSLNCLPN